MASKKTTASSASIRFIQGFAAVDEGVLYRRVQPSRIMQKIRVGAELIRKGFSGSRGGGA